MATISNLQEPYVDELQDLRSAMTRTTGHSSASSASAASAVVQQLLPYSKPNKTLRRNTQRRSR